MTSQTAGLADGSMLMGSVFTAPALEWQVDPWDWPACAERHDGRPIGGLILAIGAAWLALAARDLVTGGSQLPGLGAGGGWLSLAIGMALTAWGCRVLMRRQTIRIDRDGVHVRIRHVLGVTAWSEPLARYRGVVWRSEPVHRREVQLIELWHEDPDKTVTLFSSTGARAAEEAWQAWGLRLGLAPLRHRDAARIRGTRDAELAGQEAHGA